MDFNVGQSLAALSREAAKNQAKFYAENQAMDDRVMERYKELFDKDEGEDEEADDSGESDDSNSTNQHNEGENHAPDPNGGTATGDSQQTQ